jgi:hypothetical protein
MSITPSPAAQPESPNPNPQTPLTLFKPTGLILERPPSPAEIPKGTIRPLPGHHFEQTDTQNPQIDPLKIKVERVDPDELQIINHLAKKARLTKPSKRLVREVLSAIKEMQAEQSAPPHKPNPQNQSAAIPEDVVPRDVSDRPRSDNVQRPKRRRISPPRPSPGRATRPASAATRTGYCHHKDAQLRHIDTTSASMFDDTVNLGSNDLPTTILRDNVIDLQNTDAEVPTVMIHDDVRHPDTEARDEAIGDLQDDPTQLRRSTASRCAN